MATLSFKYVVWRDGRPRFTPGPKERALGFASHDLRHGDGGAWFSAEETQAWAAAKLAEILEARRRGSGKLPGAPAAPAGKAGRTFNDLMRAYLASEEFKALKPGTQVSYRSYARAVTFKADGETLERFGASPLGAVGKPEAKAFFNALRTARGMTMARQVLAVLGAAWKWGTMSVDWRLGATPFSRLGLPTPPPRHVVWTVEEVAAFVRMADADDRPQIADAVLLALLTSQRQGDVLSLTPASIVDGWLRLTQSKTGAKVAMPIVKFLAARLELMAKRRANAPHLVSNAGEKYSANAFRKQFARLREKTAAGDAALGLAPCPSIASKRFQDLRDTALTWIKSAGARDDQFAAVSGHALATVNQIMPHYYAPGAVQATEALEKLEASQVMGELELALAG